MDELDAVRAFRAQVPAPSDAAREAAKAALQRRIEREASTSQRRLPHLPVRRLTPLAMAALLVLALTVGWPLLGAQHGSGDAAARELTSLAAVAARQPSGATAVPLAGSFAYTRSQDVELDTVASTDGTMSSTLDSFTREIWIGADGSGRIRQLSNDPSSLRNMDQVFSPGELALPWQTDGFAPGELSRLAGDPRQLAAAIRQHAADTKNPVDYESFVVVGDLLRESVAPAEVRAALFRVAAQIPGVELVGHVSDPTGRSGVSVALTHDGVRSELIFDSQTSALLAERQTLVAPVDGLDFPVGTVIGSMSFLSSGVVASTSDTP